MTRYEQGNLVGWGSVAVSAVLWLFGLILAYTSWLPPVWLIVNGAYVLSMLSIALPIVAAWRASRFWLLMLLSPLIGCVVMMAHVCG